jgi:hypothetical protein
VYLEHWKVPTKNSKMQEMALRKGTKIS